jgi:hypothetical protein
VRRKRQPQSPEQIRRRAGKLETLYNLTWEDYQRLIAAQEGVCPISLKVLSRPNVDHRHSDGLIRGLLDWKANRSIAFFNDDPAMLRRAAEYLENPPAVATFGSPVYGVIGRITKKVKNRRYGPDGGLAPTEPEHRKMRKA